MRSSGACWRSLDSVVWVTSQWLPCSGRGQCNSQTGQCTCDAGYDLSDGALVSRLTCWELLELLGELTVLFVGLGGQGKINDCGYRSGGAVTLCPGAFGVTNRCSGHGRCSGAPTYRCQCEDGFSGPACNMRKCPMGRPWFEESQVNDVAHLTSVQCSNAVSVGVWHLRRALLSSHELATDLFLICDMDTTVGLLHYLGTVLLRRGL